MWLPGERIDVVKVDWFHELYFKNKKINLNTYTNEGKKYYKLAYEILYIITMEIYHKLLIVDVPSSTKSTKAAFRKLTRWY